MGQIWGAANREEGYKLGRKEGGLVIFFDVIIWTSRGLYRFFLGRPLLGDKHRKADATFLKPATRLLHPSARPPFGWYSKHYTCWSKMPEWRRAAFRVGALCFLIAVPWAWYGHSTYAWSAVVVTLMFLGLHGRVMRMAKDWKHRRDLIKPLEAALAPHLGQTPAETIVRIPRQNGWKK